MVKVYLSNSAVYLLLKYLQFHCSPTLPMITDQCLPNTERQKEEDTILNAAEVKKLLEVRVIEPNNLPCRTQAFVVKREFRKLRLVIDYSKTINNFPMFDAYPLPND
ncbi:hypothetical protein CDAR_173511 [Caerostris darwini]|uniref:Uncharacterized protein n=1 Tax=Caerostris darwini TaxID=1538125 RepID=A0AAV4SE45_9ARAC|nr:hypothetical protein CDAR_173511 [Caerostris darwini]